MSAFIGFRIRTAVRRLATVGHSWHRERYIITNSVERAATHRIVKIFTRPIFMGIVRATE
jgi:hypothetical protein